MKVLFAQGSSEVAKSLLPIIRQIPTVELLAPTQDAQTTIESMRKNDPEVLVVSACISGAKEADLLQTIRDEKPFATVIVLTNLTFDQFLERLEVWGDFLETELGSRTVSLLNMEAFNLQSSGMWVKFSCGEFGLLRLLDDMVFDVVATTLQ